MHEIAGILCAGGTELAPALKAVEVRQVTEKTRLKFYEGTIGKIYVIAACSGMYKVNAAIAAGLMIEVFGVDAVVRPCLKHGLIRGKHSRPHSFQISRNPEEPEGTDQVPSENQQENIGCRLRDRCGQSRHHRLDESYCRPYQHPPGQGEGQADPAAEVSRDLGVVPEADA